MVKTTFIISSPDASDFLESQIHAEARKLREKLDLLGDRLVELGTRIEPVLKKGPEYVWIGAEATEEDLATMAENYRENRWQVEGMISKIVFYLDRIEL